MNKLFAGVIVLLVAVVVTLVANASPRRNLAMEMVMSLEPAARCTAYFADVGEQHVYSALCKLPDREVRYCIVSTAGGPACQVVVSKNAQPAAASTDPAAPTEAARAPGKGTP